MWIRKGSGCVSDQEPVARSPVPPAEPVTEVAGWAVSGCRSGAPLLLTDCTPLAKVVIKAPPAGLMAKAIGVPFGRATRENGTLVAGSGPGEWTVFGPPGSAPGIVARHRGDAAESAPGELVTVIDLTHGRALFRITGARAADLLALLCPADLTEGMAPDGAALRSAVAAVAADIVRDDRPGRPSYLLHCERSSGLYLFRMLREAGEPLGIGVDGFRLPGI
jgi:heterotetrameric sarcosine oxidase gamma subunit